MIADQLFSLANTVALLGWLTLILAGRRRHVATLVTAVILPALLAICYVGVLAAHWGESNGGFGTLTAVSALFANRWLLLGGWIHYLAFDLFIGSWQVRDAQRTSIPHWMVIPCLLLTFLFGPAGLLCYFGVRFARTRHLSLI